MKKFIQYSILACMIFLSSAITGSAQESSIAITFDGDAQKFIEWEQESNTFVDMMPDEQRVQKIHLSNDAHQEMRFYMSSKIQEALGEQTANGRLVYEVTMQKDDETFFTGKIGGVNDQGKEYIGENFLLATLKQGESCDISLIMRLDGNSMDDTYQDSEGSLDFRFSVEYDDENPITNLIQSTPVINQIPGVNTGDFTNIYLLFAAMCASVGMLLVIVIRKKKSHKN